MRHEFSLDKKQKNCKLGYSVWISNVPGDPFHPVGGVFPTRYLAEQYFHRSLATSHTIRKYRIVGVRLDCSPREMVRNQLK